MSDPRTAVQQALEALESLHKRGLWGDFYGVADNLRAALKQMEQESDVWGAGYEAGYAAGMAEQPEQEPCDIAEDGVCEALECCKNPPRRETEQEPQRIQCPECDWTEYHYVCGRCDYQWIKQG